MKIKCQIDASVPLQTAKMNTSELHAPQPYFSHFPSPTYHSFSRRVL